MKRDHPHPFTLLSCSSSRVGQSNIKKILSGRGPRKAYVCFFLPEGGKLPLWGYRGMCVPKGDSLKPFWSEIGYGLCPLDLNWVSFIEEASSSLSIRPSTKALVKLRLHSPCARVTAETRTRQHPSPETG